MMMPRLAFLALMCLATASAVPIRPLRLQLVGGPDPTSAPRQHEPDLMRQAEEAMDTMASVHRQHETEPRRLDEEEVNYEAMDNMPNGKLGKGDVPARPPPIGETKFTGNNPFCPRDLPNICRDYRGSFCVEDPDAGWEVCEHNCGASCEEGLCPKDPKKRSASPVYHRRWNGPAGERPLETVKGSFSYQECESRGFEMGINEIMGILIVTAGISVYVAYKLGTKAPEEKKEKKKGVVGLEDFRKEKKGCAKIVDNLCSGCKSCCARLAEIAGLA